MLLCEQKFRDVWSSAGSIPDSYDIYRYLNLVRYSIFDTRYFRRKCNFVDIFRGYLKRLRHVHLLFFKKLFCYETFRGKRNPNFFLENPNFFSRKSDFFSKTYKIRGLSLSIYYFSKTYKIRCLVTFRVSPLHRLCRA